MERGIGIASSGGNKEGVLEKRNQQRTNVAVFKAVAVPTLTYGCESLVLREREKSRLQAAEMRVLRKIAGV